MELLSSVYPMLAYMKNAVAVMRGVREICPSPRLLRTTTRQGWKLHHVAK